MKGIICLITFCFVFLSLAPAMAIEVTYEDRPDVLLGGLLESGAQASEAWVSGSSQAVGLYTNTSKLWGITNGIVLSSGDVQKFGDGPNTSSSWTVDLGRPGDADLTKLSGFPTFDATTFGFDFSASDNQISFDFVFCSEEYSEFVGSNYNDVFGVWLQDSSGNRTQLTFDDEHKPITINQAWMKGGNPPDNSTGTELDGCTVPLRTMTSVAKGQNYRIKFGIADASDHVYDSTVYLNNFKGASTAIKQPKMYGLFVGYRQEGANSSEFRGDLSAQKMEENFKKLNNVTYTKLITGDMKEGGILQSTVKSAIDEIKNRVKDGDVFFIYIASHGGHDVMGPETTTTFGDEVLKIGSNSIGNENYLNDDELYSMLTGMDGINKWVFIDACESGGFWGNNSSLDGGDLEKLKNIYFMASAEEGKLAYFSDEGLPLFSYAIEDAMALDTTGKMAADINKDGVLSFDELAKSIKEYAGKEKYNGKVVAEMELGDTVLFTADMWTAVMQKNVEHETNLYPLVNLDSRTDFDLIPPTLTPVVNKSILWPPDHKMKDIIIDANASDNSGRPVTLAVQIASNEPVDRLGDGHTSPDWTTPVIDQATGKIFLKLRAERSGIGSGREYVITIRGTDTSGNSSGTQVAVKVPRD